MNREAKIGLFVLIALGVMAFFVLRTSDIGKLLGKGDPTREVRLKIDDATGIREGTSVEIAGVRVGKVLRIELEGNKAVAVLSLPQDMVLHRDAIAQVRTKGVLGERYIALDPGRGQPASDQATLDGSVPASLDDITETIQTLGDNLIQITETLKAGLRAPGGDNRVAEISANIQALTEALVQMAAENRGNIQQTSGEMARLATALNRDIPALVQELSGLVGQLSATAGDNRPQIDAALSSVADAAENLKQTSASFNSIAAKVDSGEGTVGRLLTDDSTIDKLNQVLDTANESLDKVAGMVDKVDETEISFRIGGDYHFEQDAYKGGLGVVIRPNPNKYYLIEALSISDDLMPTEFDTEVRETFDPDGNLISRTVITTEDDDDDIEINAQLAYRFGSTFLRAGLFETEPGAAFDFLALDDRLELTMAGWDFGNDILDPHFKFDVKWQLYKNIRINAGIDHFLEDDYRSAIFGTSISWKDEDLKILVGSAGRLFR